MNLFVFGLGYSALNFVLKHQQDFANVAGTVTDPDKKTQLIEAGIEAYVFSDKEADPEIADALARADVLLVSTPPGDTGDPVLLKYALPLIRAKSIRKIIYLSTVGVYGDRGGAWVDETSLPMTTNQRSLMRLAVENLWRALVREGDRSLYVLRLSGIYGPGRNALVQLRKGTAKRLVKPGQVFNRIHVEDIMQAIALCCQRDAGTEDLVFNITDNEPAPPQDVVTYAASLMEIDPPPEIDFETADLTEMARSFYSECKRVSNKTARQQLNFRPLYPSYREGMRALWEAGEGR
ncbi:SDR family oxidoreductase [Roseiarcaceae bacterium H3SJ34-1]|uniref:SDR family oxidoreductase n=1 Tax=Terripilifer ovatus TaxID=3032367 RepID=UPI003AB97479|nr:SDR family oxidoreductase [Roseiarcaceae bacterium H3SJ34-1]